MNIGLMFQFHKGSIKTGKSVSGGAENPVSIP